MMAPPWKEKHVEENEYQPGIPDTIPVEQDTILFYGKPLIVVRLPDGHSAVVIRSLCENLELERKAQVRRIQRTEAIADDLVPNVSIETDGGPQKVQVLILRSVVYWVQLLMQRGYARIFVLM